MDGAMQELLIALKYIVYAAICLAVFYAAHRS